MKSLSRVRASAVQMVDRLGLRNEARALVERWSPSPTMRRDGRDRRHIDAVLAAVLRPDDLCVDVGANIGSIAATMVRVAPKSRHLLVEPLPDLAQALAERFPSCEVHAVALSDRSALETFTRVPDRLTRSGLRPTHLPNGVTTEEIEVPVTTLDALVDHRSPRLVKLDVEGTELDVLRGGTSTLRRSRPLVLFEHLATEDPSDTSAIYDLFMSLDYRVFDIDGAGPLDAATFIEACSSGRIWNFLAGPS